VFPAPDPGERLKYLTDEKSIRPSPSSSAILEGRLHTARLRQEISRQSWDRLTFDGCSIRDYRPAGERLRLVWTGAPSYWCPPILWARQVLIFGERYRQSGDVLSRRYRSVSNPRRRTAPRRTAIRLNAAKRLKGFSFKVSTRTALLGDRKVRIRQYRGVVSTRLPGDRCAPLSTLREVQRRRWASK